MSKAKRRQSIRQRKNIWNTCLKKVPTSRFFWCLLWGEARTSQCPGGTSCGWHTVCSGWCLLRECGSSPGAPTKGWTNCADRRSRTITPTLITQPHSKSSHFTPVTRIEKLTTPRFGPVPLQIWPVDFWNWPELVQICPDLGKAGEKLSRSGWSGCPEENWMNLGISCDETDWIQLFWRKFLNKIYKKTRVFMGIVSSSIDTSDIPQKLSK